MWRLIFLGLIIWLVIYLFKQHLRQSHTSQSDAKKATDTDTDNENTEDMVQCTACAVHLPRSEALLINDNFYCCKAHIPKK